MTEAELQFPPLLSGEACDSDAFETACQRAIMGCDAGLICYHLGNSTLEAALVFAPEVPLRKAMAMLPLCGIGFQNALGALAPPEVAVHLEWAGGIQVNGASCGAFRTMASDDAPDAIPEWLVVGFTLPLWPQSDTPGDHPDQTALYSEGCADVQAPALLEAWSRHTLNWISRWEEEGTRPLHAEWRGLAHGVGEDAAQDGHTGTFLGVDEDFGMLLRDDADTHLIPLTRLLENAS
ncbi:MAG: DUF4444 domain-containing protein [Pelagimonas sp.]|uniref:biotin/lipoate--protein ligase family protein n=1 Tax=Pelagimonas sp. TaxID=2073170 RepID=UPI003D6ACBE4